MSREIDQLFYTLQVRTEGVQEGLANAQRSLARFTDFVKANPAASTAALGAALIAVGTKATSMARDVEAAGRRINAVFPGIVAAARPLSNEFGIAQTAVVQLFDTIERNGASSRAEIEATARATLKLNQALAGSPDQLEGIAGALDQVLDLFHLNGEQADQVAAKLFKLSAGKVPVQELADAFRASATVIRSNGISFDDAAAGLAKLTSQGVPARQAAASLNEEIQKGSASFHAFIGTVSSSDDAVAAFNTRVQTMGEDAATTSDRIHEQLNNDLIDLGNTILPVVNKNLENLSTLLDEVSGRADAFNDLNTIGNFGLAARGGRNLSGTEQSLASFSLLHLQQQVQQGDLRLGELNPAQLQDLTRSLQSLDKQISNPVAETARLKLLYQLHQLAQPAAGSGGGTGGGGGSSQADLDQLAKGQGILADLSGTLAGFTDDLADDTAAALAKFRVQAAAEAKDIPPALAAQFQALVDRIIAEYEKKLGDIRSGLQALKDTTPINLAEHPLVPPTTAEQRRQGNLALLAGIPDAGQQQADRLQQHIDKYTQARAVAADAAEKDMNATLATAHLIEEATRGAIQLGQAFGAVDDATAAVLSNLAQVAANVGPMIKAIQQLKAGTGGVGNVIATSLPVLGGIASLVGSLFGDSPEEKARRAALEHNSEVIEKLTQTVGELGLAGVSGRGFASASAAAQKFDTIQGLIGAGLTNRGGAGDFSVAGNALEAQLNALGTSKQQLQDLADSVGLQVNFFTKNSIELAEAFKQLNAALQQLELTQFAHTFAGQLDELQARFQIFDIKDPIQQLQQLIALQAKAYKDSNGNSVPIGSSAIANAFAGLDLSTQAGRDQASVVLQGLFNQLDQANKLSPDQQAALLGGLDSKQFLDTLLQLKALLTQANQNAASGDGSGVTTDFTVVQQITKAEAGQIAGGIVSIDARMAELVDLAQQEVALLGGGRLATSAAAAAALPSAVSGAGDAVVIEQLLVEVTAPPGTDAAAAAAMGDAVGAGITRQLGDLLRRRQQLAGDPVSA